MRRTLTAIRTDTVPQRLLGAHLAECALALQVDRLRAYDWTPFLGALQQTRPSFERVTITSQYGGEVGGEQKRWARSRPPPAFFEPSSSLPLTLFSTLRDCLYGSARLTSLTVENVLLSAGTLRALVDGLAGPRALAELRLPGCRLGDAGTATLCAALRRHTRLATLDLARNDLGPAGFECIAVLVNVRTVGCVVLQGRSVFTPLRRHQGWATANDTKHWEQTLRAGPSRELPPRPSGSTVAAHFVSGSLTPPTPRQRA
jgi:hypothetical protein